MILYIIISVIILALIVYNIMRVSNFENFTTQPLQPNIADISSIYYSNSPLSFGSLAMQGDLMVNGDITSQNFNIFGNPADHNGHIVEFYQNGDGKAPYMFYDGKILGFQSADGSVTEIRKLIR